MGHPRGATWGCSVEPGVWEKNVQTGGGSPVWKPLPECGWMRRWSLSLPVAGGGAKLMIWRSLRMWPHEA